MNQPPRSSPACISTTAGVMFCQTSLNIKSATDISCAMRFTFQDINKTAHCLPIRISRQRTGAPLAQNLDWVIQSHPCYSAEGLIRPPANVTPFPNKSYKIKLICGNLSWLCEYLSSAVPRVFQAGHHSPMKDTRPNGGKKQWDYSGSKADRQEFFS